MVRDRLLCLFSQCRTYRRLARRAASRHDGQKEGTRNRPADSKSTRKSGSESCMTLGEKCKNILATNMHGVLTTVKADAQGSKEELYSSPIQYMLNKNKPILWLSEEDLHTVNLVLDERGSLCVNQGSPSALVNFLRTIGKFPARVTLVGDVVPMEDDEISSLRNDIKHMISFERKIERDASYSVKGILNSSKGVLNSRLEALETLLEKTELSSIYQFDTRSCNHVDIVGKRQDVDVTDFEESFEDSLSPFYGALIEGINRNNTRRLGLMLFCHVYLKIQARDALMLSIDRKGFDVLGKVSSGNKEGVPSTQFEWEELRFSFGSEVEDINSLCKNLSKMEEEALKKVSGSVI